MGVDIGCGMNAVRLSISARTYLTSASIRSAIDSGGAGRLRAASSEHDSPLSRGRDGASTRSGLDAIVARASGRDKMQKRFSETWICQLGTLGGGNHFIEVCVDEAQRVWVMLHSGCRGSAT